MSMSFRFCQSFQLDRDIECFHMSGGSFWEVGIVWFWTGRPVPQEHVGISESSPQSQHNFVPGFGVSCFFYMDMTLSICESCGISVSDAKSRKRKVLNHTAS